MTIKNILGSVGFDLRGTFDAAMTYQYLNVVLFMDHLFICKVRGGTSVAPPTTYNGASDFWFPFVENLSSVDKAKLDFITVTRAIDLDLITVTNAIDLDNLTVTNAIDLDNLTIANPFNLDQLGVFPTNATKDLGTTGQVLALNSPKTGYELVSSSGGSGLSIVNDTAEYAALKTAGFMAGDQVFFADDVALSSGAPTPATVTFTVIATPSLGFVTTPVSGFGSFFNTVTAPDPTLTTFFIGTFTSSAPNTNVVQVTPQSGGEFLTLLDVSTATTDAWAASLNTLINGITTDAAGTLISVRQGQSFTTRPSYQRLFNSEVSGSVVTWTSIATGSSIIAPTFTNLTGNPMTAVSVDGTDSAMVTYKEGTVITFIKQDAGVNTFSIQNGNDPVIIIGQGL